MTRADGRRSVRAALTAAVLVAGTFAVCKAPTERSPAGGKQGEGRRWSLTSSTVAYSRARVVRDRMLAHRKARAAAAAPRHREAFRGRPSLVDVFGGEARVPAFADRREDFFARVYVPALARLAPGAEVLDLECRASTCRVLVAAPGDDWTRGALSYMAWGERTSVRDVAHDGPGVTHELIAAFGPATQDHDWFEQVAGDRLVRVMPDLLVLRDTPEDPPQDSGAPG